MMMLQILKGPDNSVQHSKVLGFWTLSILFLDSQNQGTQWRMPSSGMLCHMALDRTNVPVKLITRATLSNISEDGILHSHRRENLKSYQGTLCFKNFIYICPQVRRENFYSIGSLEKRVQWLGLALSNGSKKALLPVHLRDGKISRFHNVF
jgi:hypothetical protein